mmetsp:Transcript_10661/g.15605  ORF Transcript_10661/g.15605 Transcript_10661/m.15605 type:complete len:88 (-) Transcript_10661:366-629(-)
MRNQHLAFLKNTAARQSTSVRKKEKATMKKGNIVNKIHSTARLTKNNITKTFLPLGNKSASTNLFPDNTTSKNINITALPKTHSGTH